MFEDIDLPFHLENESLQNLAEAGYITVIFLGLILLVRFCIRFILRRSENRFSSFVTAIKFQNQTLVPSEDMERYAGNLVKLFTFTIYIPVIYFYLLNIFLIFPKTKDLATLLLETVSSSMSEVGMSVVNYLPNIVILVIFFFIARTVLRMIQHFFSGIESKRIFLKGFYPEWADPTQKITRIFVIILFLVLAFPYLPGSGSPAFQGLSIFIGVLLSIGSSGAVTNMISGLVLTYMRAFNMGDRVRIADTEGEVVEKSLFVTRIRTIKNVGISIPNSMVLNNHIINYSDQAKKRGLILNVSLTLGYDIPWQKVQSLLLEAVSAVDNIAQDPKPFVLQKALNDFYVEYEVNAYTHKPEIMSGTYSDINQRILEVFDAAGIEIASPHLRMLKTEEPAHLPNANPVDEHLKT